MTNVLDEINPQAVELVPFTKDTLAPLETLAQAEIVTLTSLDLSADISYEAYESIGVMLGIFDRATKWWIGDWLVKGEDEFPDRYAQAATLTGLSEQTLMQRVTTARAITPRRRRHLVNYSVHVEVRKLPPRQQSKWLAYAEKHGSTVGEIRAQLKGTRTDEEVLQLPTSAVDIEDVPHIEWVVDCARVLLAHAEDAGMNVICRREDVVRLRAALGEES